MKFYCDQCSAKYSIPDEKVRGKVVKVRCKECDHVMTVRGNRRRRTGTDGGNGGGQPSSAGADTSPDKAVQWYYSHEGETYGPHPEARLKEMYADGEIPTASYVWRKGFDDWKPAEDVDSFSGAIARQRGDDASRRMTQGVGGDALEAVEPTGKYTDDKTRVSKGPPGSFAEDDGAKPEREEQHGEEAVPEARTGGSAAGSRQTSTDQGTGRAERLERLRNRLQSSFADSDHGVGSESSHSVEAERTSDTGVTSEDRESNRQSTQLESGEEPTPEATNGAETAQSTGSGLPPSGSQRLDESPDGESAGATSSEIPEHEGLFDAVDEGADDGVESTDGPASSASGADTDIPTAPELGDDEEDKSLRDSVSESLLIQIDNIKKTDRGEYLKWGGVAVALLAALGGAWWYLYNPGASPDLFGEVDQEESRTAIAGNQGGLEFQTYSEDEVLNIGATEVPEKPQEGAGAAVARGSEAATEPPVGSGESTEETNESSEPEEGVLGGGGEDLFAEDDDSLERALAQSNRQKASAGAEAESKSGSDDRSEPDQPAVAAQADDDETDSDGESDPFAGIGEIDSPTAKSKLGPNIEAPEDNLGKEEEPSTLSAQLSKERISRAIRNVSKSVGTCRRRHARHGTPLEPKKVTIIFTVQRDGLVSSFALKPESVENTRFDKCLEARKGRWNFGPIPNAPQQMKAPFILQ